MMVVNSPRIKIVSKYLIPKSYAYLLVSTGNGQIKIVSNLFPNNFIGCLKASTDQYVLDQIQATLHLFVDHYSLCRAWLIFDHKLLAKGCVQWSLFHHRLRPRRGGLGVGGESLQSSVIIVIIIVILVVWEREVRSLTESQSSTQSPSSSSIVIVIVIVIVIIIVIVIVIVIVTMIAM